MKNNLYILLLIYVASCKQDNILMAMKSNCHSNNYSLNPNERKKYPKPKRNYNKYSQSRNAPAFSFNSDEPLGINFDKYLSDNRKENQELKNGNGQFYHFNCDLNQPFGIDFDKYMSENGKANISSDDDLQEEKYKDQVHVDKNYKLKYYLRVLRLPNNNQTNQHNNNQKPRMDYIDLITDDMINSLSDNDINNITNSEIKKAYRNLARIFHPDRNKKNINYTQSNWDTILEAYQYLKKVRKFN